MKEIEKKSWPDIANCITGRTQQACISRYSNVLKGGEKRAYTKGVAWSAEEDERIIQMKEIEKKSWPDIAKCITGRIWKACESRYNDYLNKGEKRAYAGWTAEEDARIIQLKEIEKKSWKDIAKCFTGRTWSACAGRYSHLLKEGERYYKGDRQSAAQPEMYSPGQVEIDEDGNEMVWL
jgi:hypothetical protein